MAKLTNTTTTEQFSQLQAREIDFIERFTKNWDALIEIMGIMRPIRKTPGTKLTASTAELTLANGTVAEGDEVPLSIATVKPVTFVNTERKLDGINNGICDSTFALNNTINGNFRTLDGAICNIGYQNLQNTNALQTQIAQCCCTTQQNIERNTNQGMMNTSQILQQISSCCCDIEKANMQNRFDAQAYNCNTLQAIDKLGDRIVDYMANEKAQALRDENHALRLAASQSAQNQYIINALRPYPTPAFTVAPPYQFTNCGDCACA